MHHNLPVSGIKRENMQRSAKAYSLKIQVFLKSVDKAGECIRTGSRWPPPNFKYVSVMVFYKIALRERKDIRKKTRMDKLINK